VVSYSFILFIYYSCNEWMLLILCIMPTEQAQFGACGRILVVVMEGVGLKPHSASGKPVCLPPPDCF
jgi:hypothetical protein